MTQYLLSVQGNEDELGADTAPEEMQANFDAVDVFNQELKDSGVWVFAGGLQPSSTAAVVNATGGDVLTTDGPFAETKEQLGGFWIIEATDLDVALALAAKGSAACAAPVEVRPFQEEPEA